MSSRNVRSVSGRQRQGGREEPSQEEKLSALQDQVADMGGTLKQIMALLSAREPGMNLGESEREEGDQGAEEDQIPTQEVAEREVRGNTAEEMLRERGGGEAVHSVKSPELKAGADFREVLAYFVRWELVAPTQMGDSLVKKRQRARNLALNVKGAAGFPDSKTLELVKQGEIEQVKARILTHASKTSGVALRAQVSNPSQRERESAKDYLARWEEARDALRILREGDLAETSEWDRARGSGDSSEVVRAAWLDGLRDEMKERSKRLVVLEGSGKWSLEEWAHELDRVAVPSSWGNPPVGQTHRGARVAALELRRAEASTTGKVVRQQERRLARRRTPAELKDGDICFCGRKVGDGHEVGGRCPFCWWCGFSHEDGRLGRECKQRGTPRWNQSSGNGGAGLPGRQ